MNWFRWHHGSVTDPKFKFVAKKSGAGMAEVLAVWATMLEAASLSEQRGCHGKLDFESIDLHLDLKAGKSQNIYESMAARGLVNPEEKSITSWLKRQPLRERDDPSAADRKREQRARDKPESRQVTPSHAKSHPEEIRGEEIRGDNSSSTPTVLVDVASEPSTKKTKPTGAKRRSQIPIDFFPSEQGAAKAASLGLTLTAELTKFTDYHQSKGTLMADWQAAWRTWVGNAHGANAPLKNHEPAWRTEQRQRTLQAVPSIAARSEINPKFIDMESKNVTAIALG